MSYAAGHVYLAVGDANADGRNDVVITSDDGTRLLLQGSDGKLGSAPVIAGGTGPIMFSDMDRDGLQDLVRVGPYSHTVHVLLQGPRGLDYPRRLDFPFTGSSASVLDMSAVGDLNSDGCPDVVGAQVGSIVVMRGVGCAH